MTDDKRGDALTSARRLPRGSMVILRSKAKASRRALAFALIAVAHQRDLIVLIADDPALATEVGAHGVHFPEARASSAAHWRARRPKWLITVAAHGIRGLLRAGAADAVLLSPIFATESHKGAPFLGATRAALLACQIPTPVYALGGITGGNAGSLHAPYCGVAAIGGLST
jgi:thiamine-phosphate pyrophosphorylase